MTTKGFPLVLLPSLLLLLLPLWLRMRAPAAAARKRKTSAANAPTQALPSPFALLHGGIRLLVRLLGLQKGGAPEKKRP